MFERAVSLRRLAIAFTAAVALAACAGGPTPPKPGASGGDAR